MDDLVEMGVFTYDNIYKGMYQPVSGQTIPNEAPIDLYQNITKIANINNDLFPQPWQDVFQRYLNDNNGIISIRTIIERYFSGWDFKGRDIEIKVTGTNNPEDIKWMSAASLVGTSQIGTLKITSDNPDAKISSANNLFNSAKIENLQIGISIIAVDWSGTFEWANIGNIQTINGAVMRFVAGDDNVNTGYMFEGCNNKNLKTVPIEYFDSENLYPRQMFKWSSIGYLFGESFDESIKIDLSRTADDYIDAFSYAAIKNVRFYNLAAIKEDGTQLNAISFVGNAFSMETIRFALENAYVRTDEEIAQYGKLTWSATETQKADAEFQSLVELAATKNIILE